MKNGRKYLGDPHKAKRKWLKKKESSKTLLSSPNNAKNFWDNEYKTEEGDNFSLSTEASEDLKKFCRFLEREYKGQEPINKYTKFVDAGCGNGRNSFYLAENFGAHGIAYDISSEAIRQAETKLKKLDPRGSSLDISFSVQNLSESIPAEDSTQDLVIDAVASHVLTKNERIIFRNEVVRVLTPGSYYFLKSLLLDDDSHAKQMIRDYGQNAGEENSYIHPTMGIFEHVPTEEELVKFYEPDFYIDKIERSFAHRVNGRANKRRYIVLYLRKR
jgi:ubiquinone/menaquinone biosynthesis C-methylase UbiE